MRQIKIELCNETNTGEVILAKEYLSIDDISNYRNEVEYDPTYGPVFIDLYNRPNNCRTKKKTNEDEFESSYTPLVGDGSFYIARLLMSISSKPISPFSELKDSVRAPSYLRKNYLKSKSVLNEFLGFCVINDASMIDSRYKNGELRFKLSFGRQRTLY